MSFAAAGEKLPPLRPKRVQGVKMVTPDLMQMLHEELNDEHQKRFVDAFHMYLNHDANKDFVIDMDEVFEWLGFTRKGNAKERCIACLATPVGTML